jgi:alpha-ribazole phosphatase
MRCIWVRHGETEDNIQGRYLGHYNAPLAPSGREQAAAASEALSGEHITRIYTSDLLRCVETAHTIGNKRRMKPVLTSALRELDFGEWDRKTYDEIIRENKVHIERWYGNPYEVSPPQGETLSQLGERLDNWLHRLQKEMQPDETALLVSHGGPIRWFQAAWLEGDGKRFWYVPNVRHGEILKAEWHEQAGWVPVR